MSFCKSLSVHEIVYFHLLPQFLRTMSGKQLTKNFPSHPSSCSSMHSSPEDQGEKYSEIFPSSAHFTPYLTAHGILKDFSEVPRTGMTPEGCSAKLGLFLTLRKEDIHHTVYNFLYLKIHVRIYFYLFISNKWSACPAL